MYVASNHEYVNRINSEYNKLMFRNLLQSSARVKVRVAPKEELTVSIIRLLLIVSRELEFSSSVISKRMKEFSSKRSRCQEISKTK